MYSGSVSAIDLTKELKLKVPENLTPLVTSALKPPLDITLVKDGASLDKLKKYLSTVNVVGIDYETNIVPTIFDRRARTFQIGDKNQQFVIDWMEWSGNRENLFKSQGHFGGRSFYGQVDYAERKKIEPVVEVLRPVLDSKNYLKLGVNLEFEYLMSSWGFGMRMWNLYDCHESEKVIFMGLVRFDATGFWGMDGMCARRLGVELDKTYQKTDWMEERPLTQGELEYAALDCRIPFVLKALQYGDLQKGNLFRALQIENDAIPAFGDMKLHGKKLNGVAWRDLEKINDREIAGALVDLDTQLVPVVGSKDDAPDPEHVAKLEAEWRDLGEKSPREKEIADLLRTPEVKKNPELKAALVQERTTLEEQRKAQKAVNRKTYNEASKAFNRFHKDALKWPGKACINYGSHKKLRTALQDGPFGLKSLKSTKDEALEKFADKPVIKALRRYRKYQKRKGTYGDKWLRLDNEPENPGYTNHFTLRLHSDIIQLGADTGRTASREPNFQNLPKEEEYRACFVSREGYKMLTIDYNGCELRIMADYSQEKAWVDAFNNGWDVHSVCAEFLYGDKWRNGAVHEPYWAEKTDKVTGEVKKYLVPKCAYYHTDNNATKKGELISTGKDHEKCECPLHKEYRGELKAVNFGIAYGKTAYGLAADLEVSKEAAQALLDKFAATFPVLWAFLHECGKRALKLLESRTVSQRRRAFTKADWEQAEAKAIEWLKENMKTKGIEEGDPGYNIVPTHGQKIRSWKAIEEGIERRGMNTPIQGSNADIVKLAVGCGFDDNGKPFMWHRLEPDFGTMLENIVHDECVAESPDSPDVFVSPYYRGPGITEGNAQEAYAWMVDCMERAGAAFIKSVPMTTDGHIANCWKK